MHPLLLLVLALAAIFFVQAKAVWLTALILLLILFDIFGGIFAKFFGLLGTAANVVGETVSDEAAEVEAAKTKPPAGKKFIDEGLLRIGKEIGKTEKDKADKKRMKSKLNMPNIAGAMENFPTGLGKLFRR